MSILVVGAIHHDVIVAAPAIPRLDETLPGTGVAYELGGKGANQALAAARFGASKGVKVAMAGSIGSDDAGLAARNALQAAGVDATGLQQGQTATGMSIAISLPDGSYGAVIVSGANLEFGADALQIAPGTRWLVLQNELPASVNLAAARKARAAGARVLLNAAPTRSLEADLLALTDLLVVNALEAEDLLQQHSAHPARDLRQRLGCACIVTRGGQGLDIAEHEGSTHIPAHRVNVISTHGAGDAFIGALVVQLAPGKTLRAAASFANTAAALHVSTPVEERARISEGDVLALSQA